MINQRLFDHYGIDTSKDLKIRERCPRPFDTVLIDKKGSCYACECQSWLPQSIGNLQLKKLEEIVGSTMHKTLQASIMDGTYRYCNEHQCSYIKNKGINDAWDRDHIRYLRLAIDDSCNLQCPSCRKKMIFHKEGSAYQLGIKLADKINDWLSLCQHPLQVHMGSDGDPFASHVYRHFMEQTPRRNNITYSILTNGLMIKDFYHKIPHIIDNLQELGVSIDGASKSTYEKLRLGGKWDKINENLEFISKLKDRFNFKFRLHFVVQKENYHEMEDIILLGKKYDADRVWLNKMEDWNVFTNFSEVDIFRSDHPLHNDYKKKLKQIEPYLGFEKKTIVEIPTLNISQ
jgi:MoaA/NifB/PqqE/SkfB family radical SAM enzyme